MTTFELGNIRYYEDMFPSVGDFVMIRIDSVADMGAYATLLEYNNMKGFLPTSEYSKRRIRSVKKIIRVGRIDVASVIRVDTTKGYIDLSKKKVSVEDVDACEKRYHDNKKVHQIMCHLAQKHSVSLEELNRKITWVLAPQKKGNALDVFKDPNFLKTRIHQLDIAEEIKTSLIDELTIRLAAHPMKMKAKVDVVCYGHMGVDGIKNAFQRAKEVAETNHPGINILCKVISSPLYSIEISCSDVSNGERILDEVFDALEKEIKSYEGGSAEKITPYQVIGGTDNPKETMDESENLDDEDEDVLEEDDDDDDDDNDEDKDDEEEDDEEEEDDDEEDEDEDEDDDDEDDDDKDENQHKKKK